MSEDLTVDWFLLERYVTGQTTPTERAVVERWSAAHPDHQQAVARVQAALRARGPVPRDWRRADAIDTVMTRVQTSSRMEATAARPQPRETSLAPERLIQRIRQWFESATELAAAMLLDVKESPLTADEVAELRNRIDDAKRDQP